MTDWQPIETAPKDDYFLATDGTLLGVGTLQWGPELADAFHSYDGKTPVSDYDGPVEFKPTHWMPLPDPPKD